MDDGPHEGCNDDQMLWKTRKHQASPWYFSDTQLSVQTADQCHKTLNPIDHKRGLVRTSSTPVISALKLDVRPATLCWRERTTYTSSDEKPQGSQRKANNSPSSWAEVLGDNTLGITKDSSLWFFSVIRAQFSHLVSWSGDIYHPDKPGFLILMTESSWEFIHSYSALKDAALLPLTSFFWFVTGTEPHACLCMLWV